MTRGPASYAGICITAILALLLALTSGCAAMNEAKSPPAPTWLYPAIAGHGGVHPGETLPFRPQPAREYRIVVDVITTSRDAAKIPDSLERLARVVNLMAYAGVPRDHTHIVAVLDEGAGLLALTNAEYRSRFRIDNPNLALLHELNLAGVQLLVCSQAMAAAGLPESAMSADVTVSLSALTDFVVLGQEGYSYMRL